MQGVLPSLLPPVVPSGTASVIPSAALATLNTKPAEPSVAVSTSAPAEVVAYDDRLVVSNREKKGKKSLNFAEPGKYIQLAEELR